MLTVVQWINRQSAVVCLVTMVVHPAAVPSAPPIRNVPSAWPASINVVAILAQASAVIKQSVRWSTTDRSASALLATQAVPTTTARLYDQPLFPHMIQFLLQLQFQHQLLPDLTYNANQLILVCPLLVDHTHNALRSEAWPLAAASQSMWVCHPIVVPSVSRIATAPRIVPALIASAVILVQVFVASMPCVAPPTTSHNVFVRLD